MFIVYSYLVNPETGEGWWPVCHEFTEADLWTELRPTESIWLVPGTMEV